MKIIKAETAGFCFGVNRAVKMANDLLDSDKKIATLGPLIHNAQCVGDLEKKGAVTANNISEIPDGFDVVIRSHGVARNVYDELSQNGVIIHDATCPFVTKIHKIATQAEKEENVLLVAGDKTHPEVEGIVGHTSGQVYVFNDDTQLISILDTNLVKNGAIMVAQTTFEIKKWVKCCNIVKKLYTNVKIFDTICIATWKRQQETEELSRMCDLMIIIGGKNSSNTQKLAMVAGRYTKSVKVESKHELNHKWFEGVNTVGVTAGASTPSYVIEEVLKSMSEMLREEELSFEEMLDATMKPVFAGQTVKGIVSAVSPSEVQVDIGMKQTGFIRLEDLTNDSTAKADEIVHKGEEIDLIVTSVKDQEGIVYLSKKRYDENKGKADIAAAAESGEIMEGVVSEYNSGGVVVLVNNVRVFVPRSQATLRHSEDYTKLVKQNVSLKITQCEGRHIVGSIRQVLAAEADELRDKFWQDVEVDKQYTGKVKSLTNYGAFVDIGGVDGLVHISELSWDRIRHPSEVLSVGDEVVVYIKELDSENKKVSLGYKQAADNPWEKLKNEFPIGTVFEAPVVSVTKFGAFVRILPGVDGLVHISEISHDRIEKVSDALKADQIVKVKLTEVDFEKQRISLSIKALIDPPVVEQADEIDVESAQEDNDTAQETAE